METLKQHRGNDMKQTRLRMKKTRLFKERTKRYSDGIYLFRGCNDCNYVIERNDRLSVWDIYWIDNTDTFKTEDINPDRFIHDSINLKSAVIECMTSSLRAAQ